MKIDGDLAELMGIHIGDGCISVNERYKEYYLGGDITEEKEYHDTWVAPLFNRKIMIPLFNKKVIYKEYPKVGIYGFYIFNKELVEFFNKLGINSGTKLNIKIPNNILKDKGLSKRFLRGLFDTDGTIYFDKNRSSKNPISNQPNIQIGTVSKDLAFQVLELLRGFNLNPRMKKPRKGKKDKNEVYSVLIYRRADIEFFINKIGFKNSKHITKWLIYKKFGFCPPYTTLKRRKEMLKQKSL